MDMSKEATCSNSKASLKSGGQTWYNQQTYRAINQAIGRVIRHRNDYGAIILCDERFSQASSISQLPNWMKHSVKKITDYGMAINELKKFFNVAIESVSSCPIVQLKFVRTRVIGSCLIQVSYAGSQDAKSYASIKLRRRVFQEPELVRELRW